MPLITTGQPGEIHHDEIMGTGLQNFQKAFGDEISLHFRVLGKAGWIEATGYFDAVLTGEGGGQFLVIEAGHVREFLGLRQTYLP